MAEAGSRNEINQMHTGYLKAAISNNTMVKKNKKKSRTNAK